MQFLSVFLSLLAGAVGWGVTNYFLKPTQRIEDLRRRAHEELIFNANIDPSSPDGDRAAARLALRRIASQLLSESESATGVVRYWVCVHRRWELETAGRHLMSEANTIDHPTLRGEARDKVIQALRLPSWAGQIGIDASPAPLTDTPTR
jgi:hypothetical protein